MVPENSDGLHPVVGMHSVGEMAQLTIIPGISSLGDASVDDFMVVDDSEDEWVKVHDVKINGQVSKTLVGYSITWLIGLLCYWKCIVQQGILPINMNAVIVILSMFNFILQIWTVMYS